MADLTPGQVAYEAARDERLSRRPSDVVIGWGELNEGTRSMWEAAAQAVRRPLLQSIATGDQLDAERRGYVIPIEDQVCPTCQHHSVAHISNGCSLDDCPCVVTWARLRG